jgi:hypothetical protein
MELVQGGEMPWGANLASHRQGEMAHKVLFEGEEGSPDNHLLVLAREGSSYYSPRHRHAWDQVRLCLEGAVPLGKDLKLDAGEVAYFPEGVRYGPHEGGPDRIVLLLQFGGASGKGYLSAAQLRGGHERLAAQGVFEAGVFRRSAGEGPKNQDAYEAIWAEVTGAPIAYPEPRYKAPVVMRPEAFAWRPDPAGPGVQRKAIGMFPDRGLSLELFAISPGAAWTSVPSPGLRLIFVREGRGVCEGAAYAASSAVRLGPSDAARFEASLQTELFVIEFAPVCALAPDSP